VGRGDRQSPAAAAHQQVATTVSVTCLNDGRAHDVPDVELVAGGSRSGYYRAVCGHLVSAASMVEPDGEPCRHCAEG
jgi:hypothetical protein